MSIDTCYEGVIATLTAEHKILSISKKLLCLTENDARVLYVYEVIESLGAFPPLLEVYKTVDVSVYYRNLGNRFYQKQESLLYYMAWQLYNLSLLHAPIDSEEYALALANRSAVFFSMKKYNECLNDIEKVYATKFPEKLREKLENRKKMSEKLLSERKPKNTNNLDVDTYLTMQNSKDPIYLCASSKLEVVFSKEMGRHVIAKEDIEVGEILVHEEPYFVLLLKSQILFSCSYCLSRSLNLMPCPTCCFALYCSEECKSKAWADYHSIECALMATLIHLEFTKLEWLALRTVIKARHDHSDWESLFLTIQKAEENLDSEYRGCIMVDGKWVYDSKHYTSIHTLASNVEKRSVSDIFQKSVTAAVFLKFLTENTNFLNADSEDEKELIKKCVAGTLLHHIMTSPTNMHGLASTKQNADGNYVEELSIASAPYAYHSLINHSCAPNVVRFHKLEKGQMALLALRPIKKGMQLFDNYGSHHALEDYWSRQSNLKQQYKFICQCEACLNKWPEYFNLKTANLPPQVRSEARKLLRQDNIQKLQKGDVSVALTLFKPLCELAKKMEPYAPCQDLADCQETLKQCLQIFGGVVPYGCTKEVKWTAEPPKV